MGTVRSRLHRARGMLLEPFRWAEIEQLADRDINVRTLEYIDDQVLRAEKDVRRFTDAPDQGRAELANFYVGSYRRLREAYRTRFGRDLVGAFADLAKTGHVEILTSAATHGYLPLLDRPSVDAQLGIGRRSSRRLTRLDPTGIWLPECAYTPGLEKALAAAGRCLDALNRALDGVMRENGLAA